MTMDDDQSLLFARKTRRQIFDGARRIVIKVGSAVLTSGNAMNLDVIQRLAKDIAFLQSSGREVILVSSGAVAAGKKRNGFAHEHELSLQEKQALAAIGQSHLMYIYDATFSRYDQNIAQILVTHGDLASRSRYVNFKNTLFTLLKMGVIPIINENDSISTEELQFGDNDTLAALVTNLIEGDLFICLTDVDCLYTANPVTNKEAKPVFFVEKVNETIEKMAGHSKSALGTGGMQSKISAARKVAVGGGASIIGPGKKPGVLQKMFDGDMVGTLFMPQRIKLQGRKQWIAFVLKPKGYVELDRGACRAIREGGKSLLPSGVTAVNGAFRAGDAVQCMGDDGTIIAVGLINYRAEDVVRLQGSHSHAIEAILGYKDSDVLMHRDNLVIY